MIKTSLLALVSALAVTPAFAAVVQVPEPSMLGLAAAGVAGVVIAYRIRKNK